ADPESPKSSELPVLTVRGVGLRRRADGINTAVIFSPYELVPGGGERYIFEVAAALNEAIGRENVRMASMHRYSALRLQQMSDAFGVSAPAGFCSIEELEAAPPDMTVVMGNEVVPPIAGYGRRYNVYMCQFPFGASDEYIRRNMAYIPTFDEIWVNSNFTRRYVNGHLRLLGVPAPDIRIINPPATLPAAPNPTDWRDRTTVMTVGRFFKGGHNKRQDVAIGIVRTLREQFGRSVKLQIVGALHANPASRDRFNELVQLAEGLDCEFYPNASRTRLLDLYSHAAVLIHAAGFGVDKYAYPERLEHFGIVPVEAASSGAIPVVYGEAGPAEVMELLGCPTTFRSIREGAARIEELFADPVRAAALSTQLVERSQMFSSEAFRSRVYEALATVL
ncbi:MAG: glycosyltransferase family 4 protein, partial [Acidimicrobiaceae bacterium]|nr:glycosyltransferase family 4 protein [Acidimicrobiaceae bacterium]